MTRAKKRRTPLIPAKAGIQIESALGPRFRGDERKNEETPLGIICGGGSIPIAVAKAVEARGRSVMLFPLHGFAD